MTTTVPVSSYPGRLASRNSTDLNNRLWTFYDPSARTTQKTASVLLRRRVSGPLHNKGRCGEHIENSCSIVAWIRLRGNVFTQLFHSTGCTRHISYRNNSSIVACWHYQATALSLALQFLLWANTPKKFGRTRKNCSFLILSSWRY
jgi:hypothetical protein